MLTLLPKSHLVRGGGGSPLRRPAEARVLWRGGERGGGDDHLRRKGRRVSRKARWALFHWSRRRRRGQRDGRLGCGSANKFLFVELVEASLLETDRAAAELRVSLSRRDLEVVVANPPRHPSEAAVAS